MVNFEVRKGDLFKDLQEKKKDILVHSVNARGVWGSGVAKIFHIKWPNAYLLYKNHKNVVGDGYVIEDKGQKIGCLVTSKSYGQYVDPPKKIAESTYTAVKALLSSIPETDITIHSPKLNAGLFNTPWQWTKKAIVKACEESNKNVTWIVWEL